jgi:hypothetical protein
VLVEDNPTDVFRARCNPTPVIVVTSSTAEADRAAAAYMELADVVKRVLR